MANGRQPSSVVVGNPLRIKPNERVRVALCVTWPDSQPTDALDRMVEASGIQAVRSPLHDLDVYDRTDVEKWLGRHELPYDRFWSLDELGQHVGVYRSERGIDVPWVGDPKKPHHHWVVDLGGMKSYAQLCDVFGGLVTYWEKPISKRGALNYLIHRGRPDKAQYDFDDLRVFGCMDVSSIIKISEIDVLDVDDQIKDAIREHSIRTYYRLCEWAKETRDFNIRQQVRNNGRMYVAYMDSFKYQKYLDRKQREDEEWAALTERTLDGRIFDPATGELLPAPEGPLVV